MSGKGGIGAWTREVLEAGNLDGVEWEPGRPRPVAAHRRAGFGAVLFVIDADRPRAIVVTASPDSSGRWQDEDEFGFGWSARPFGALTTADIGSLASLGGWAEVAGPQRTFRVATGRAAAEVDSILIETGDDREVLVAGPGGAFVYCWPSGDAESPRVTFASKHDRLSVNLA